MSADINSKMNGIPKAEDSGYFSDNVGSQRSDSSTPAGIDGLGRQAKKLVATINNLEAIGVDSFDLPLPKIVVIGDQSAGKSSIIEAISEIKVPRSAGTCTRCVLQINLIPANATSVKISLVNKYSYTPGHSDNNPHDFGDWLRMQTPETTEPINFKHEDIEIYLKRAQSAILCPHMHQYSILKGDSKPRHPIEFSPNIIKLDISGPDLQTLTLYDLPGIINQADEKSSNLPELVQGLACQYANNPNTIIVLACPVSQDYATSTAASLIRNWGVVKQCVGVLTKPDMLPQGDDPDQWLKILSGKQFEVGHGYFVTKQPNSVQLKKGMTHAEARDEEFRFFQGTPWNDAFCDFRSRFGTPALHRELTKLLAKEIASSLPKIRNELTNRLEVIDKQLRDYPPPPLSPYATILDITNKLCSDVNRYLQGEYPWNDLINTWRETNKQLSEDLRKLQPLVIVNTGKEPLWNLECIEIQDSEDEIPMSAGRKRAGSTISHTQGPAKRQKSVRPSPISTSNSLITRFKLDEIHDIIASTTASGVPSDTDPRAEDHMILKSMQGWDVPVDSCLDSVFNIFSEFLDNMIQAHCKAWQATSLPAALHEAIHTCFNGIFQAHRESVSKVLASEKFRPYTSNVETLNHHRQKELSFLRSSRRNARAKAYVIASEKALNKTPSEGAELAKKVRNTKDETVGN